MQIVQTFSKLTIFNRWINKTAMEVEMDSRKLVILFKHI